MFCNAPTVVALPSLSFNELATIVPVTFLNEFESPGTAIFCPASSTLRSARSPSGVFLNVSVGSVTHALSAFLTSVMNPSWIFPQYWEIFPTTVTYSSAKCGKF